MDNGAQRRRLAIGPTMKRRESQQVGACHWTDHGGLTK